MPAERLSYLTGEEQLALVDIMEDLEVTPSLSQAVKLKDLSASHRLDPDTMYEVMEKPKANQRETVKLDADTLRRFFPDYTPKQMETYRRKFHHAEILLGIRGNDPVTLKVQPKQRPAPDVPNRAPKPPER